MKTFTNRELILEATVVFGNLTDVYCDLLMTFHLTITCKKLE